MDTQPEQVLRQPDNTDVRRIAKVLDICRNSGKEFTLKVWVNYGQKVMRLHGYHIHGEPWIIIEKPASMPHFTQAIMDGLMREVGVDLKMRPVKQPGFDYHWCCVAVDRANVDGRYLKVQGNLSQDGAQRYTPFLQAVTI